MKIIVGIDIAKLSFEAVLLIGKKYYCKKFNNTEAGFRKLLIWLQTKNVTSAHTCMEATGNYGLQLAEWLILPATWLPNDIAHKNIFCLASAGGQQAPVLAAAGANVTVFDISEKQLELDKSVAERDGLTLKTVQGDMYDLSAFDNESFDYIIHPISNLYVPDINLVWRECYMVLPKNGILLSSFYNPVLFIFDHDAALSKQGLLRPIHELPYSALRASSNEPIVFGHTLAEQINGQIEAGFLISGFNDCDKECKDIRFSAFLPIRHNAVKKIIIVTGCNRGFGLAIAKQLLKNNFYIIGTSTSGKANIHDCSFICHPFMRAHYECE